MQRLWKLNNQEPTVQENTNSWEYSTGITEQVFTDNISCYSMKIDTQNQNYAVRLI